jgi:hypothetical protein
LYTAVVLEYGLAVTVGEGSGSTEHLPAALLARSQSHQKCLGQTQQMSRQAKARTREALENAIVDALKRITEENAKAWFR